MENPEDRELNHIDHGVNLIEELHGKYDELRKYLLKFDLMAYTRHEMFRSLDDSLLWAREGFNKMLFDGKGSKVE